MRVELQRRVAELESAKFGAVVAACFVNPGETEVSAMERAWPGGAPAGRRIVFFSWQHDGGAQC